MRPDPLDRPETAVTPQTSAKLVKKHCVPCEGGIPKYSPAQAREQVESLDGWRLTHRGRRIRKDWLMHDFASGMEFFDRAGKLAEEEGHHPDLHLEGYRAAWIEIWTHAVGGLTENDFILAAKIDRLPKKLKRAT